jgi:hypothetical protein
MTQFELLCRRTATNERTIKPSIDYLKRPTTLPCPRQTHQIPRWSRPRSGRTCFDSSTSGTLCRSSEKSIGAQTPVWQLRGSHVCAHPTSHICAKVKHLRTFYYVYLYSLQNSHESKAHNIHCFSYKLQLWFALRDRRDVVSCLCCTSSARRDLPLLYSEYLYLNAIERGERY